MTILSILEKLELKIDLNENDLNTIFNCFKKKKISDEKIQKLVVLWRHKGEKVEELKILVDLLFKYQPQKDLTLTSGIQYPIVDICGTGGDKSNSFNVSTVASIVLSSLGLNVIKHSGRSTTSISGSVDILNKFGIEIDLSDYVKENCFKETSLMFVSSKILRDVFGDVKRVCKEINSPGFVNLLGPLTNPYKTSHHLLGVSSMEWGELLSRYLLTNKSKKAIVVCSKINKEVFLDEFSLCGNNYFWEINGNNVKKFEMVPEDLSCKKANLEDLIVSDIYESMQIFEEILRGKINGKEVKCSRLNIVAINVGAVLYLTDLVKTIKEGYNHALVHIQSGKVWEHFQRFINFNKVNKV